MPVAGIYTLIKTELKTKEKVQILGDSKTAGLWAFQKQIPLLRIFPANLSTSDALLFSLELRKAIKKYSLGPILSAASLAIFASCTEARLQRANLSTRVGFFSVKPKGSHRQQQRLSASTSGSSGSHFKLLQI